MSISKRAIEIRDLKRTSKYKNLMIIILGEENMAREGNEELKDIYPPKKLFFRKKGGEKMS